MPTKNPVFAPDSKNPVFAADSKHPTTKPADSKDPKQGGDSNGDAQDNSIDLYQQMVKAHNEREQQFQNQSLRPAGNAVECDRIYSFNQTGNFLISSTFSKGELDLQKLIPDKCWLEFQRAAVFLAAMTKALHVTDKRFDYESIRNVVDGSGLWIQMTEEEVHHETHSVGASFSAELVSAIVGLMLPEASVMKFASTMTKGMGQKAVKIGESGESEESKLANMIIICENIFGVPFICMIMVSIDSKTCRETFEAGPCLKASKVETKLTMTKEVYYWVSPDAIENDSEDIIKAMNDPEEAIIVKTMTDLIRKKDIDKEKQREKKADDKENSNPPPADNANPPPPSPPAENTNPPPPSEEKAEDQPSADSE